MTAVVAAIGAAFGAVKSFAAASAFNAFLVNLGLSVALSAASTLLDRILGRRQRPPGITTEITTTGGVEPQAFILGRYATAGHLVAPPYSHGQAGKTPLAYLTYIIEVSDIPGVSLSRLIVNDDYTDIGETADPDYGLPLLKFRTGGTDHAWVKFYDGTQTTADPMLVEKYGDHPDRPWTADHIGTDTAYAILTFRFNREIFNGLPSVRFELEGIPLLDPRTDAVAPTRNPMVMVWNILRGIDIGGRVYGGGVEVEDIPEASWFAAMNACDASANAFRTWTYRAGMEVFVDQEPLEVVEELLKACAGQISEFGGVWRTRVGGPAAPVKWITDEDIVVSDPATLQPFPGLEATTNAVGAQYPSPESLWKAREAPLYTDAGWEAEDGGRRLPATLSLPAVSFLAQVVHLTRAYAMDARRMAQHRIVLPPDAAILEPLDSIAWTSDANGYTDKVFEVVELLDREDGCQEVMLRERDSDDFTPPTTDPDEPGGFAGVPIPGAQVVPDWAVSGTTVKDGSSTDRRPALLFTWDPEGADDAEFIRIETRVVGSSGVPSVLQVSARSGETVLPWGILPGTDYESRARYVLRRPTDWTDWEPATTPGTYLDTIDLAPGAASALATAYTEGEVGVFGNPTATANVQEVTLTLDGDYPTTVRGSAQIGEIESDSGDEVRIEISLRRGSTGPILARRRYDVSMIASAVEFGASVDLVEPAGVSGEHTYFMRVSLSNPNFDAVAFEASERSIVAWQQKR